MSRLDAIQHDLRQLRAATFRQRAANLKAKATPLDSLVEDLIQQGLGIDGEKS